MRLVLGACLATFAAGVVLAGCASSGPAGTTAGPGSSGTLTFTNLTVTGRQVYVGQTLNVSGVITVPDGTELDLQGSIVNFSPAAPATETLVVNGSGRLVAGASCLQSRNGNTWCMSAHDLSQVILNSTDALDHAGLRFWNGSTLTATASKCGLVKVYDNCGINLQPATTATVGLYITGPVASSLDSSELVTDTVVTESFNVRTSSTSTAHISLDQAEVLGWWIYASGSSWLSLGDARSVTLSLHLVNAAQTVAADITSPVPSSGTLDFSASGNPKITYTNSRIAGLAIDATGASNLSFTGHNHLTAASASGTAQLSFGPGTLLDGTVATANGVSQISFLGATRATRAPRAPTFVARDSAVIRLDGVNAGSGARAMTVGAGQVQITGGSGWNAAKLDAISPAGSGGIYLAGDRVPANH